MACGTKVKRRISKKCKEVFGGKEKGHVSCGEQWTDGAEGARQVGGAGGLAVCSVSGVRRKGAESSWLSSWIGPERPVGATVGFWEIEWCYQNSVVYAAAGSKARMSEMTSQVHACLVGQSETSTTACSQQTPESALAWVADPTLNRTCKYSNYAWKIRGQLEASGRFGLTASRFWNSRLCTTHCLPPRPCCTHLPGSHFTISILLKRNLHTMVILANQVLFPWSEVWVIITAPPPAYPPRPPLPALAPSTFWPPESWGLRATKEKCSLPMMPAFS